MKRDIIADKARMKITPIIETFRAGGMIICLFIASLWPLGPRHALATGGAFPYVKHGGGTTDGEPPYNAGSGSGVDRSVHPDYGAYYNNLSGEAGRYKGSECTHCHEPHASFGESEPAPNSGANAGPDPYLLMKEYATSTSYAELCWYCHENFSNINGSGSPAGYGRWTFYQGKTVYQNSSHYVLSSNMYWPGTSGDPWTI